MITITASIIAALLVLALGHVAFTIYPQSAIAMARHNLFNLRDELFDLGAQGKLNFKSPGYKATRQLINGLIKYAHDVSLMQIFTTKLIMKARKQRITSVKDWEKAIDALSKEEREYVDDIYRKAMVHMVRLLITKSVLLTSALAVFLVLGGCVIAMQRSAKAVASALSRAREGKAPATDRDEIYRAVLAKRTGKKFKRFVTGEARRYSTPGFGSQLAMA